MQTKAEKYLIKLIVNILKKFNKTPYIINLGAAKSTVVEHALIKENLDFVEDRCDIENCKVNERYLINSYICPLENMKNISSNQYDLAFANFVFEHINNIEKAVSEINRILKHKGNLLISLSNPQAPEFILAKYTPTSFHQLFRKKAHDKAFPVKYNYKNINNLKKIFRKNNFKLIEEKRFAFTYGYLHRFFLINYLSLGYDKLLEFFKLEKIKSHVVLVFEKY
jgi:ubiquinone/menaquinone biosynthesis C-methylase UbiE